MGTKSVTKKRPGRPSKLQKQAEELQVKIKDAEDKPVEMDGKAEIVVDGEATGYIPVELKEETATKDIAPVAAPLPKHLQDRIDAANSIFEDIQTEVGKFKTNDAYLEGDVPVDFHGLGGPGFGIGQRSLNYLELRWLDPLKHYRWSNKKMVDYHRGDGFAPCDFKEFTQMVTARGGGHTFQETVEHHVQSGDLILVCTSQDWYAKLQARTAEKTARKEMRAKNSLYSAGEKHGVEVYEGGDAVGPGTGRLLEYLEKELGPGARQAFLGK